MGVTKNRGMIRRAGRAYGRIRERVSTVISRTQLGPAQDMDLDLMPSRTWHNHRAI
jgi:hypothetical protein